MNSKETSYKDKSLRTKIAFLLLGIFLLSSVAILRPVPIVSLSQCTQIDGVLTAVAEGGTNDVCLQIKGQSDKMFYINRGIESGLDIEQIRKDLVGKKVKIAHPNYWTPLDPFNSTRHVSMFAVGEEVLYDETIK